MLQKIHDRLTGIFAIGILVVLGIVFVFWGVDASVGTFTRASGVEVNGEEIGADRVRRSWQDELSRYQQMFGAAEIPEDFRERLRKDVLDQEIRAELVRQRTRERHYAISDAQLLESLHQIPAFQVAGKFSADAYHAALQSAGIPADRFEAEQRELGLARQLDRGIQVSAFVLPGEYERRVALLHEARELAWVTIPAAAFQQSVSLSDAELESWYEAHRQQYLTNEAARVEYLELNIAELAAAGAVDEARLQEFYDNNNERYSTPEKRRARHVLIENQPDAAAGEARARAVLERARAGEDFAALARESSADSVSAAEGGDLDWAERSAFVGPFADAVWAMQPGEIRGPVSSEFGWHVIRLDGIQPGTVRPFADVRAEIEAELRREEVERRFNDLQEQLETEAFEAGGDLARVAGRLQLGLRTVERFTRSDGGALGPSAGLVEAVFAPDMLAGQELRTIELAPGRVVALRVAAHEPARERPFAEVRDQVQVDAGLDRARKLATERAAALQAELAAGGDWQALTLPWAAASAQPRLLRRDEEGVPAEVLTAAFRAATPEGRPRYGTAQLEGGDSVVWQVSAVRGGTLAALSPDERSREAEQARQRSGGADSALYVAALQAGAKVKVNPQLFD
ncbi:MAG: hypothetical protein EPO25_01255 [Gammaproteobacteria bacterium]|nr:MAG: hypothetical protein EPO25_01255 [Gammaproteobacteria bacterium]